MEDEIMKKQKEIKKKVMEEMMEKAEQEKKALREEMKKMKLRHSEELKKLGTERKKSDKSRNLGRVFKPLKRVM